MSDYNTVCLAGYVSAAPTVKYTGSGMCIVTFSMAVEHSVKDKQAGEWKNEGDWHSVKMFGEAAEDFAAVCKGKTAVKVAGRLTIEKWVAQDGTKREKTVILADRAKVISQEERRAPRKE